jgi:hypothetical protein
MLNCKQATKRMSEALDRPAGLSEGAALRLHLLICKGCRNYQRQLRLLRQACAGYLEQTDDVKKLP